MLYNVLVYIEAKCKECGKNSIQYRWLPSSKWEKFANTEVIICKKCGSLSDILTYRVVPCQLRVSGNSVKLEINGKFYDIVTLFTNKVKFHLGNLPQEFDEEDTVVLVNKKGKEIELIRAGNMQNKVTINVSEELLKLREK